MIEDGVVLYDLTHEGSVATRAFSAPSGIVLTSQALDQYLHHADPNRSEQTYSSDTESFAAPSLPGIKRSVGVIPARYRQAETLLQPPRNFAELPTDDAPP